MVNTSNSGIHSLAGFSYQIKVFIYYATTLTQNEQIEFEGIEDVSIKNNYNSKIESNGEKFVSHLKKSGSYIAIQVKRTKIDSRIAEKIIYNWLLLESQNLDIVNYELFTDSNYENISDIFSMDKKIFYESIISSKKRANALVSRVKKIYKDNFNDFEIDLNNIKNKYKFINMDDFDNTLDKSYDIHFKKSINTFVHYERMKQFLGEITIEIMECVDKGNKYILTYIDFLKKIENICSRFNEEEFYPIFSNFESLNPININNTKIATSREYRQLKYCGNESLIRKHLLYKLFYKELRDKYIEKKDKSRIEEIENRTFDNFESVKNMLILDEIDAPLRRLERTKEKSNSSCVTEEIRYGSAIFLTREKTGKLQISWKDEEEEKNGKN